MFTCLKKKTPARQIDYEIYESEMHLLQWQRNAEEAEVKVKQMRSNIEMLKLRLKRLRAQRNEISKIES